MNLTIEIPDDRATLLQMQARARGISIESWLLELAGQGAVEHSIAHLQKTDPGEWAKRFRAWADAHDPSTPVLSEESMGRESIYRDPE